MRVQAEPSDIFVNIDGTDCRVWNAVTEDGEQIFLFVARVAVANESRTELVDRPIETPPPQIRKLQ